MAQIPELAGMRRGHRLAVAVVPAQVIRHPERHAGRRRGIDHARRVVTLGTHRLLDQHVLASLCGSHRRVGMKPIGGGNQHRMELVIGKQCAKFVVAGIRCCGAVASGEVDRTIAIAAQHAPQPRSLSCRQSRRQATTGDLTGTENSEVEHGYAPECVRIKRSLPRQLAGMTALPLRAARCRPIRTSTLLCYKGAPSCDDVNIRSHDLPETSVMRMEKNARPMVIVAIGLLSLPGTRAAVQAQGAEYVELFSPAAASRQAAPADILGVAMPGSVERIEIDLAALRSPADTFLRMRMTFGQGAHSLNVVRDEMEWTDDRTLSWFGSVEEGGGSVLFSVHRRAVYGSIETGAGAYRIEPAAGGGYWLYQLDLSKEAQIDDGGVEPPVPYEVRTVDASLSERSAKTTLTVLVIYTNGFKKTYPGAHLNAQVNQLIQWANQALSNSKVPMKLKVVAKKKRKYTDGGELTPVLNDFRNGVGTFKKVAGWRRQFGADLVVLLRVFKEDNVNCGRGVRMGELSVDFAPHAYSVTQVGRLPSRFFCHDRTMVHEFGHNWGSNHNEGDDAVSVLPRSPVRRRERLQTRRLQDRDVLFVGSRRGLNSVFLQSQGAVRRVEDRHEKPRQRQVLEAGQGHRGGLERQPLSASSRTHV